MISVSTSLAHTENENVDQSIWDRDVLAGELMGLREYLSDDGIQIDLGLTQIYQNNFHGGLSTDSRRGRYSGSYDIEIGIEGGSFYILTEGSWTDTAGIDGVSDAVIFGARVQMVF